MARPKPTIPVDVPFYARTTRGERAALEAALAKRSARLSATDPAAPPIDFVRWFRLVVSDFAREEGVAIVEPGAPPTVLVPVPAKKPAKPAKKAPK